MKVPDITRRTLTVRVLSSSYTAATIPPSSNSLNPPRLFTNSTTSSVPSFSNDRNDRSLSSVAMIRSRSCGTSSLRGGTGERRRFPDSLWMPSPISISSAARYVSPVAVPGTCHLGKSNESECMSGEDAYYMTVLQSNANRSDVFRRPFRDLIHFV